MKLLLLSSPLALAAFVACVEVAPSSGTSYVFTESGESVDDLLIREGLGRAWTKDGQHADALAYREEEARRAYTG